MLHKLRQRAQRPAAEYARALSDFINNFLELGVLRFKKLVQIVELHAGDVPMIISRLGVHHVFVGKQRVENLDDAFALFV